MILETEIRAVIVIYTIDVFFDIRISSFYTCPNPWLKMRKLL